MLATRPRIVLISGLVLLGLAPSDASARATESADFGLALVGPDKAQIGGQIRYAITLTNAGPTAGTPKVRFTSGRGAADTAEGNRLRTESQTISKGSCRSDPIGTLCEPGSLAPGETVTIEVVLKLRDDARASFPVQATVDPTNIDLTADPNATNNHVELATKVAKPITVGGLPTRCSSASFTINVEIAVANAKLTKVSLDGKVVETSEDSKFKAKLAPQGEGRHVLSIVVQPRAGSPLASLRRKFSSC